MTSCFSKVVTSLVAQCLGGMCCFFPERRWSALVYAGSGCALPSECMFCRQRARVRVWQSCGICISCTLLAIRTAPISQRCAFKRKLYSSAFAACHVRPQFVLCRKNFRSGRWSVGFFALHFCGGTLSYFAGTRVRGNASDTQTRLRCVAFMGVAAGGFIYAPSCAALYLAAGWQVAL